MNRLHKALFETALAILLSLGTLATPAHAATLPPAPSAAASFDAGILHVDKFGSGAQTMILIPGLGSGPWAWYGTIAHFSSSYTIYVITLPGFDGSPKTMKTPLFDAFSDSFWQMLDDKHIDKPVVIGHSLGGTLAIKLGEEHPERLRAIVAVDGLPVFPMLAGKSPQDRQAAAAQMAAAIGSQTPEQALAYERKFMSTIGTRDADLVEPVAQLQAKSDPAAVAAWAKEDLGGDLRPGLSKITVPVMEVMPFDPATAAAMGFTQAQSVAFYQSLVAGTPKVQVVAIAPARHFAMLDQPDAFYATVTQFLDSLR